MYVHVLSYKYHTDDMSHVCACVVTQNVTWLLCHPVFNLLNSIFDSVSRRCHVAVIQPWAQSALVTVAMQRLQDVSFGCEDAKKEEKLRYNAMHHAVGLRSCPVDVGCEDAKYVKKL